MATDDLTVTFLLTDVQGSTRLWEQHAGEMDRAMARHHQLIADLVACHHGHLPPDQGEGDARFAVFDDAAAAVACALAIQLAFVREPWPSETPIRSRIGLHTGPALHRHGNYFGASISRTARIRGLAAGGQTLLSQATADAARSRLPDDTFLTDLGSHRLKDLTQPEQIFQLAHAELEADFPNISSLDPRRHNLPLQLSSFVGREGELAEVSKLLESTRLLTLTGAGGSGKTRTALHVAAEVLDAYLHGVWLVELAPLSEPALIASTIATALGVQEEPGRQIVESLLDYLRSKQTLLILDNCEHLIDDVAREAENLLSSCPRLVVLATSREPLRLAGETVYPLPTLETPAEDLVEAEALIDYGSVRLFLDRASSASPSFSPDVDQLRVISRICRRLDGIPLAIELAAARVRAMTIDRIDDLLTERFSLLTGGSRTALPRQRTLRATIDWSYDLLRPPERMVFAAVSVFGGSFSVEAVEAVLDGTGVDPSDILIGLVDRSLVMPNLETDRYWMLESIRTYAAEKLEAEGTADARAHAQLMYIVGLCEEKRKRSINDESVGALAREAENIRAALSWALECQPPIAEGLRLAERLGPLWRAGRVGEGRRWLRAALEALPTRNRDRARALHQLAGYAMWNNEWERARLSAEEAIDVAREVGFDELMVRASLRLDTILSIVDPRMDPRLHLLEEVRSVATRIDRDDLLAAVFERLGGMHFVHEDVNSAFFYLEEARRSFESIGDEDGLDRVAFDLATMRSSLGIDLDLARDVFRKRAEKARERRDIAEEALALLHLADIADAERDFEGARSFLEAARDAARQVEHLLLEHEVTFKLALVATNQNDLPSARQYCAEAITLLADAEMAFALTETARVENLLGNVERADGRFEIAEELFLSCLSAFDQLGDRGSYLNARHSLGELRRDQGRAEEAEAIFEQVATESRNHGLNRLLLLAQEDLAESYRALGKARAATELDRETSELREKLLVRGDVARRGRSEN